MNFDFSPSDRANSAMNAVLNATAKANKRKADSERAMIESADTVRVIQNKVASIDSGLSAERDERKQADKENKEYTRRQTRWVNVRSWGGLLVSLLALAISAIVNWDKVLAFLGFL